MGNRSASVLRRDAGASHDATAKHWPGPVAVVCLLSMSVASAVIRAAAGQSGQWAEPANCQAPERPQGLPLFRKPDSRDQRALVSAASGRESSGLDDLPEGLVMARLLPLSQWHASVVCAVSDCSPSLFDVSPCLGRTPTAWGRLGQGRLAGLGLMRLPGHRASGCARQRSAHIRPLRSCGMAATGPP